MTSRDVDQYFNILAKWQSKISRLGRMTKTYMEKLKTTYELFVNDISADDLRNLRQQTGIQ